MSDKLKPCPFCGKDPVLLATHESDNFIRWYEVRCDECGIGLSEEYESSTVELWNKRAALAQPQNDAEAVAELATWRDELSEIISHLGAAITQSVASDDQVIMDHVKAAHEIAKIVRRKA